jgi:4-amino-4-deoxy-L-arabinose transferase-like glycosyltransferase
VLKRAKLRSIAIDAAVVVSFFACMYVFADWWNLYAIDGDEGINLEKAALLANGFPLYTAIWSDQPPLLTYILSAVHSFAPFSISAARTTILVFSAILVLSLFRIVRRFEGTLAAAVAVTLLVTSVLFLRYSVAVMVGVPAIALALLALDVVTVNWRAPTRLSLVAGAIIFAASVAIKMFTFVTLPAFLVVLLAGTGKKPNWDSIGRTAIFIGVVVLCLAFVYVLLCDAQTRQLFTPHIKAALSSRYAPRGGPSKFVGLLVRGSAAAVYTACGFAFFLIWSRRSFLIPLSWLVFGLLLFSMHRPLWDHHILVVLPPICWLGGAGVAGMVTWAKDTGLFTPKAKMPLWQQSIVALGLMAVSGAIATKMLDGVDAARSFLSRTATLDQQSAHLIASLASTRTKVIVADRPIDAYHAGLLVPPNLAVWSNKRLRAGVLSSAAILKAIKANDAAVLLRRFRYGSRFLRHLNGLMEDRSPHFDYLSLRRRIRYFSAEADNARSSQFNIELEPRLEQLADRGGLGGIWKSDQHFERASSSTPLPIGTVVTRPRGSAQELGSILLAVWRVTHDDRSLLEAVSIGRAISCVQTPAGGWLSTSRPAWRCVGGVPEQIEGFATFDDGTSASILYFAFDLDDALAERHVPSPPWLTAMIDKGLAFVVRTQDAHGGWPQQVGDDEGYHQLLTLNDDVTPGLIRLLLTAHQRYGRAEYLTAAERGGNFLLEAQGPSEQAAFAQQYSRSLKPAGGRSFEPLAYSSLETAYAINALLDLYMATGLEKYLDTARRAADWLSRSKSASGVWARFYEIGTNRPIYSDRHGTIAYDLSETPEALQESYRWRGGTGTFPEIGEAFERLQVLRQGSEALMHYDEALARTALLAKVPSARIPLDPRLAKTQTSITDSTRAFVEFCAAWVAKTMQGS